jgi:hypothetical protein
MRVLAEVSGRAVWRHHAIIPSSEHRYFVFVHRWALREFRRGRVGALEKVTTTTVYASNYGDLVLATDPKMLRRALALDSRFLEDLPGYERDENLAA